MFKVTLFVTSQQPCSPWTVSLNTVLLCTQYLTSPCQQAPEVSCGTWPTMLLLPHGLYLSGTEVIKFSLQDQLVFPLLPDLFRACKNKNCTVKYVSSAHTLFSLKFLHRVKKKCNEGLQHLWLLIQQFFYTNLTAKFHYYDHEWWNHK